MTQISIDDHRISQIEYKQIWVRLPHNRKYPIYVGRKLFGLMPSIFEENQLGKKVAVITNPQLRVLYADKIAAELTHKGYVCEVLEVPAGEQYKSMDWVGRIINQLLSRRLERNDTIVAVGGGVIGDLAGFVAAIYLRGINLVHVPTSLLAQVDSAIGGKTGVNHPSGKNLIGAFYQPRFTLVDLETLSTLPKREIKCGLAEVVKYGLIMNPALFEYIERHQEKIATYDVQKYPEIWEHMIRKSCQNKASVVARDEKEGGLRAILNLGHTIGHGIEAAFKYGKYLHGEAVAIGTRGSFLIAQEMGLVEPNLTHRVTSLFEALGFELSLSATPVDRLMNAIYLDKKVKSGQLVFVLPVGLGEVEINDTVSEETVKKVLQTIMG